MHIYERRNARYTSTTRRLTSLITASVLVVTLAACGGDSGTNVTPPPPPPTTGAITVTTSTTGAEPDADGYTVAVDGGTAQTIGASGSLTLSSLSAGSHTLQLGGVAGYCAVNGDSAQTVSVVVGDTAHAAFAVACEDGTIVFTSDLKESNGDSNIELYMMRPDSSGLVQLTFTTAGVSNWFPRWSPDGSKIAYASNAIDNFEIIALDFATRTGNFLTGTPAFDTSPSWSPDGTKIAFASDRDGGFNIYVMDASDGRNVTPLTADTLNQLWPVWSPDGSKIAFVSTQPNDHTYNIYVMDSDGQNRKQLTHDSLGAVQPSWSPDGTRIAFSAEISSTNINIFTMASDGSDVRQLTHNAEEDESPTWSPGGGRIAYCVDGKIYVMTSDGSQSTYITTATSSTSPCTLDWGRSAEPEFNPTHSMSRGGRRGT